MIDFDDERVLQDVGIYRYHHPLEDAAAYKDRLNYLQARVKDMVKRGRAIESADSFTFNNSLAKGRKMTADLSKLMIRAFNAEADIAIRTLRAGNVRAARQRIERSRRAIERHGSMMELRISPEYFEARREEIELTADFLMRKQEEREAAKAERARIREEKKVREELAEERERLEKERTHLENALEAVRSRGAASEVLELEEKLAALDGAIAQNDYRAANIRAGYVYVISNRGALGPGIVKIGLTRRLDPRVRIRELGGASVPFRFDVHALYFSEDAVTLENELHQAFAERRVNMANQRKEFFFVTPEEVKVVLQQKVGNLLEFTDRPEPTEYLQSLKYWPEDERSSRSHVGY